MKPMFERTLTRLTAELTLLVPLLLQVAGNGHDSAPFLHTVSIIIWHDLNSLLEIQNANGKCLNCALNWKLMGGAIKQPLIFNSNLICKPCSSVSEEHSLKGESIGKLTERARESSKRVLQFFLFVQQSVTRRFFRALPFENLGQTNLKVCHMKGK